MKQMLNIMSRCTVSIAIPNEVTVKTQILLCSNRLSVPTATLKTQRASMWCILCNISSINEVKTKYNGQCSEKEPFATTGRQLWEIDKVFLMTMSSSKYKQERLGSRTGPSPWSIVQLAIQIEACGTQTTKNSLLKQRSQGEMDRGLCGKRGRCGKEAS